MQKNTVIFPVYEPFLLCSAASDTYFGILMLFFDVGLNDDGQIIFISS